MTVRTIRVERHRCETWLVIPPSFVSVSSDGTIIAKLAPRDLVALAERVVSAQGGLVFHLASELHAAERERSD